MNNNNDQQETNTQITQRLLTRIAELEYQVATGQVALEKANKLIQELQKSKEVSNNYLKKAEKLISSLENESGQKMLAEIIKKIGNRNH